MKNKYVLVSIFLGFLVIAGGYFVFKIPSSKPENSANINTTDSQTLGAEVTPIPVASASANVDMNNQLQIQDEVVGTGAEAVAGKKVTVNYTGTLTNGTVFDSSLNPGRTPFQFTLGAGEVIQGWDQGFAGMKVGGKRKLTIPPSMGYGSQDMGSIPPNSTLIFEVELLKVE